uniref:Ethanolaminephosphotransferase n=2 Tax=Tetraselmis sp. GSL018 TaxID=582737 RepID=A0A061QV84_9CHLO|mmetsp:Transcript_34832/g.82637  ORF Transcript_34832/g.82637 Transcript_34832/m.82637 type:complete len:384 (-) Transcript_34832:102-1253(-)
MPHLSLRALEGLKHYQYKPGGYTWLDELHQPLWKWITDSLPLWLAPNLITLSGLLALVSSYFANAVFIPTLSEQAPWWVYFFSGASLVLYTNLDCIDGKQARRTGTSSPLGQLFDHGVDALAVHLVLLNLLCTFGAGTTWMTPTLLVSIKVPWLLAQWEEYHTGLMLYGNGWWGVLEINYGVAAMHFLSAALTPSFWRLKPLGYLGLDLGFGSAEELRGIVLMIIAVGAGIQTAEQLIRVLRGTNDCPQEERGHKDLSTAGKLTQVLEKAAMGAAALAWLYASPPRSARAVLSTFGVVYAWEATNLITAHMTKEPVLTTWWPAATMALASANAVAGAVDPALVAFAVNGAVIVAYLHHVVSLVGEICAALNINCLTIRPKRAY